MRQRRRRVRAPGFCWKFHQPERVYLEIKSECRQNAWIAFVAQRDYGCSSCLMWILVNWVERHVRARKPLFNFLLFFFSILCAPLPSWLNGASEGEKERESVRMQSVSNGRRAGQVQFRSCFLLRFQFFFLIQSFVFHLQMQKHLVSMLLGFCSERAEEKWNKIK